MNEENEFSGGIAPRIEPKIEENPAGQFRDDVIELHNHTLEFYETALKVRMIFSFVDISKLKDYVVEQFEKIDETMRKIKTSLDIEI